MKRWMMIAALSMANLLRGDIKQITLTWNAVTCQDTCVAQIHKELSTTKEIHDITINPQEGSAVMQWKTGELFSYEPFRYAMAAVGLSINSMRVHVQGTISHEGETVFLNSTGDNTRFQLVGPIKTQPGRYTPRYNLASYPLSQELLQQLRDFEQQRMKVIVSGPLLLPSHYPLVLIIENISPVDQK